MLVALSLLALSACGPRPDLDAEPAWALNWASVTPTESGLTGYQVWEFFVDGWERKHDEDFYKCSFTQEILGTVTACPLAGVPSCYGAYDIELTFVEGDCPDALAREPGFDGPPWTAVGGMPEELEADAPDYGDYVLGWYIGYEDGTHLAHGYAYPRVLEDGAEPPGIGWLNGQEYILWPGYVWELGATD